MFKIAEVFNIFDNTYNKTGNRMKERLPQIVEILEDKYSKVLFDNTQKGGMRDVFSHDYSTY